MSTLPSGVRLVALLNDHLCEIMERERANHTSMHLYCTGPYWVAFERSAYQLRRAFPDSETTPMRLFGYPFPVVMVSVTDRSLRFCWYCQATGSTRLVACSVFTRCRFG